MKDEPWKYDNKDFFFQDSDHDSDLANIFLSKSKIFVKWENIRIGCKFFTIVIV